MRLNENDDFVRIDRIRNLNAVHLICNCSTDSESDTTLEGGIRQLEPVRDNNRCTRIKDADKHAFTWDNMYFASIHIDNEPIERRFIRNEDVERDCCSMIPRIRQAYRDSAERNAIIRIRIRQRSAIDAWRYITELDTYQCMG